MHTANRLLTAAILAALSTSALAAGPAERALGQLRTNAASVKGSDGDTYLAKRVTNDANGASHVRFDRSYHGLDVIGGDFVMHIRADGSFAAPSLSMRSTIKTGLNGRIKADEATVIAGTDFGSAFDTVSNARKVVYAIRGEPTLAWEVKFEGSDAHGGPKANIYYVDADNGRMLDSWSLVETAKPGGGSSGGTPAVGTGRTLIYGNVTLNTAGSGSSFNMTDTTRGNGATYDANNVAYSTAASRAVLFTDADNIWGDNTVSNRATVAADAQYGVAATWDYYKTVHGRNGIFNDGKGVKSYVHVGRSWINASWYANAMYYGDGGSGYLPLVSLDVAGHEMSHGVTQATSGLAYSGDSGGLNEATSDIFGTMVEYFANNANDAPDYKIGEELASSPLRYMYDPNLDGNASYDCYPTAGFAGVDPHYSSGPANHFFYLLAEGTGSLSKTCVSGDTKNATGTSALNGIGRDAASKIWYRALDLYFTSGTSYPQARTATLNAASDLYGAGSANYNAVAATWSAINVN